MKAQLAVKLYLDEHGTVGGLNMYSTESEDIDPQAPGIADLFATHAALALGKARQVNQLYQALRTREVISQAVGLLMARYKLEPDAAFGFLVRTSSHSNTKVREIADRMIEHHIGEVRDANPPSRHDPGRLGYLPTKSKNLPRGNRTPRSRAS